MYVLEGHQIVRRLPGPSIGRVIAEIPANGSREGAELLVSIANLGLRDERLLDEIAERAGSRNLDAGASA